MTVASYCSPEDVHDYAATRGVLVYPARAVAAVNATSNTMELAGHGFRTNAALEFRAFAGGTLPSPIAAQTVYYAIPVDGSDSLFQVATTENGGAVDLTTAGENFGVILNIRATIEQNIVAASEDLHQDIPAHAVPLVADEDGDYPPTARRITAIRTWLRMLPILGLRSETSGALLEITEQLALLRKGLRMRNTNDSSAHANLARGASPTSSTYLSTEDVLP